MRALLLAALLVLPAAVGATPLPPRDECSGDAGFIAFRAKLFDAVTRKDANALLALTDDNVRLGFGGNDGKAAFRENLKKPEPWAELAKLPRLGCAADGSRYAIPHLFLRIGDRDAFDTFLAAGTGIALRAAPRVSGRRIARLDWELLTLVPATGNSGAWLRLRTDGGRTGYVRRDLLRSPVDYRALFEKSGGQWRMTAFLAGD
jgi:hypothetical protein